MITAADSKATEQTAAKPPKKIKENKIEGKFNFSAKYYLKSFKF